MSKAKLIGISGSVNGREMNLETPKYLIQQPQGEIIGSNVAQPGEVCVLTRDDKQWTLTATSLEKNVYVNQSPVSKTVALQNGDTITIGNNHLVVSVDLATSDEDAQLKIGYQEVPAQSKAIFNLQNAELIFDPVFLQNKEHALTLKTIQKLYKRLTETSQFEALIEQILKGVFDFTKADFAALILLKDGSDHELIYRQHRTGKTAKTMFISNNVKNLILRGTEGKGVVYETVVNARVSESIRASEARSIVATPLVAPEKKNVFGILYLYSLQEGALPATDLIFVNHLCSLVAPRIHDLRRLKALESRTVNLKSVGLVGRNVVFQTAIDSTLKVAPLDTTVLILGESGVGKEGVARLLHRASGRTGRFIPVNCGAIPTETFESEVYGHEKGSFTGAVTTKRGLIEEAESGTIFFDELGEMPIPQQTKLLRFFQDKQFRRFGATQDRRADVRIVAATNRNLRESVESGGFREDMFARLETSIIKLPSLKQRKDDIPLLADYFLNQINKKHSLYFNGFTPEVMQMLAQYDWPRNIRQLENLITSAMINADTATGLLTLDDFPEYMRSPLVQADIRSDNFDEAVKAFKQQCVMKVIVEARQKKRDGLLQTTVKQEVAAQLGRSSNNFARFLKDCGLEQVFNQDDEK